VAEQFLLPRKRLRPPGRSRIVVKSLNLENVRGCDHPFLFFKRNKNYLNGDGDSMFLTRLAPLSLLTEFEREWGLRSLILYTPQK
jgi:hypothetical protein